MGRPATGSVRWDPTEKVWTARITIPGVGRPPKPLPDVPACLIAPSAPSHGCSCSSCAQARRVAKIVSNRARNEGRVPESTAETVSEWYGTYYAAAELGTVGRKNRGRPQASVARRRGLFKLWIEPLIGTTEIRAVTAADLRRVVAKLDAQIVARMTFYAKGEATEGHKPGIAPKTATAIWSEIVNGFGEATNSKLDELRVLDVNPAIGVRPPTSGEEREQAALYPAEIVRLLSCANVSRECRRLYWAALYTGCRRSELGRLTAASIDLEHGVINVRGRKTNAARRTIPIEPGVRELFVCLVRARPAGPLFRLPGSDGGKGGTSDLIKRDLARAGVDREDLTRDDADHMPFTFHGLRHTAITHWAVAGHPLTWLLVVAGHTDATMTQRYLDKAAVSRGHFGTPHAPLPADVVADILDGADAPITKRTPGRPKGSKGFGRVSALWSGGSHEVPTNKPNRKTPERNIRAQNEPQTSAEIPPDHGKTAAVVINAGTVPPTVSGASEPAEPQRQDPDNALRAAIVAAIHAADYDRVRALLTVLENAPKTAAVLVALPRR